MVESWKKFEWGYNHIWNWENFKEPLYTLETTIKSEVADRTYNDIAEFSKNDTRKNIQEAIFKDIFKELDNFDKLNRKKNVGEIIKEIMNIIDEEKNIKTKEAQEEAITSIILSLNIEYNNTFKSLSNHQKTQILALYNTFTQKPVLRKAWWVSRSLSMREKW
jgi:hypothetical protein